MVRRYLPYRICFDKNVTRTHLPDSTTNKAETRVCSKKCTLNKEEHPDKWDHPFTDNNKSLKAY